MNQPRLLFAGRTTLDVLYWLDRLPEEDTKVFAQAFRMAPGGPACNAAITASLLGADTTIISAVGSGAPADEIRRNLDRRHIHLIDLSAHTRYETPLTTVLVSAKNSTRTAINPPLSSVPFQKLGSEWREEWGAVPTAALMDGFHIEETLSLLTACRNAGTALCLDGGSWKPGTEKLAALLTAAICSERFALPGAAANPETTLAWFAGQGVPHVAVTRGPRPILCLDRGRRFEIEVPAIAAVDTLGAGDVLHGAFCYELARTRDFEASLRKASLLASRSCEALGIDTWTCGEA